MKSGRLVQGWAFTAWMTCVTFMAVGCAVDQAQERAIYEQITQLGEKSDFEPGRPVSLREAMRLANEHNEQLAIEGENFLQAVIDKQRAVAAFLPTVDLLPRFAFGDQRDRFTLSAGGTVTLFDGFGNVAALRRDMETIEARRALLLDAQQALLLDVAQVYYGILRAQRAVEVLEISLNVQEERVRDIRARQQAGIARPLDVAQTEASASATRVTLINAASQVRNGRSVLAFITGAPVQDSPLSDDYELSQSVGDVETLLDRAYELRDDLRAAEAAARAARQDVEVAFSQYYPSVSLDLDAVLARSPSLAAAPDWTGLIRANLPIFSAGVIEADVRGAWSVFRQRALFMQWLGRQVRQEIAVAHENVLASRRRLAELQTQERAARQAFDQAEQSYNVGLATNLERLTAQDQLLEAQLQLSGERYDQKLFYLQLLRAVGMMRVGDELAPPLRMDEPEADIDEEQA